MYIIVITSNRCDPFVIGRNRLLKDHGLVASVFENETGAENFLKEYQSKWTERDWDEFEGHVLKIST